MKKRRENRTGTKLFLAAAVVLIAVVVFVVVWQLLRVRGIRREEARGIAYLESLENQDLEEVQSAVQSARKSWAAALAEGDEAAVWAAFTNSVILGDSRAVGFYSYEFLPQDRVMAKSGGKITDVDEYVAQLKAMAPEAIYLCYGLNDVGIGFWPTGEEYAAEYEKHVALLVQEVPTAKVYVCSILPAAGVGLQADPDYPRIGEYNTALKKMCEEKGWPYVDSTDTANAHMDLYQPDGLHMLREFYKYWAADMLAVAGEQL